MAPEHDDAPIGALATGTRDVDPAELPERLAAPGRWLAGAELAFKKVDSLLRGNSFAEVAELVRARGFERVLFAPAFPAQGRVTLQGRQWLRGPGGRMVAVGSDTIVEQLVAAGLPAAQLLVPEVQSDDTLAQLAAVTKDPQSHRWLWCGSAGLGAAIARQLGIEPVAASPAPSVPALAVTASRHPVLRAQLQALSASGACRVLRIDETGVSAACGTALAVLAEGRSALLDLSLHHDASAAQAASMLANRMALLTAKLAPPRRFVVIGGDSLLALCHAGSATGLLAHAAPRPGWGCARIDGGRWHGVEVLSRSGAFGAVDDLIDVFANTTLRRESA
jgi:uncharacterized protein YgbK (DUF1537 family)